MAKYINKKTGQITQKKDQLGATEEYKPEEQEQRYSIGPLTTTNKAEYEAAKAKAGLPTRGEAKPTAESEKAGLSYADKIKELSKQKIVEQTRENLETASIKEQTKNEFIAEKINEEKLKEEEKLSVEPQAQLVEMEGEQTENGGFLPGLSNALGLPEQATPRETGRAVLSGVSKFVDGIRTFITGKQPITVQANQNIINDGFTALDLAIDKVADGSASYGDVKEKFKQVEEDLAELERVYNAEGKANLRYWNTVGRENLRQIELYKDRLGDSYDDLEAARIANYKLRFSGAI